MAGLETVPCALCGGSRTRPYCTKFGYPIVKCRQCGLVYCNPRLSAEETEKRYNAEYFRHEYLPSVRPPAGVGHLEEQLSRLVLIHYLFSEEISPQRPQRKTEKDREKRKRSK